MFQDLTTLSKEHIHPLVVHFPIGLWVTAVVLYLVSQWWRFHWLRNVSIIIGVIGSAAGWVAEEMGEKAADVIGPTLCNMALLRDHAQQSETAVIFLGASFGLAALLQIIFARLSSSREVPAFLRLVVVFGLLMGSVYLVLGGHKGFRLVYQEGAGVRAPIQRCEAKP